MKTLSALSLFIFLPVILCASRKLQLNISEQVADSTASIKNCQAYLGVKKNYMMKDGIYTGGNFERVDSVVVPQSHSPHDALYQMEGPAWESDKVGYRVYLDERNRTDIFGKTTSKMILDIVGKDDLLSGNESYQKPLWWGQDIFKVGNSLGIGSVAAFINDSVTTVSQTDSVKCFIINRDTYSSVVSEHFGWKPESNKVNVKISYTIKPSSHLTHVDVKSNKTVKNFCTGLAKHDNTEVLKADIKEGWSYIALWGRQTIVDDNLGIALFYNIKEKIKITEDQLSHIVVLNSEGGHANYYFAACWEKETEGVKTLKEFQSFLKETIEGLNKQDLETLK